MAVHDQRRLLALGRFEFLVLRWVVGRVSGQPGLGRKLDGLGDGQVAGVDVRRIGYAHHLLRACVEVDDENALRESGRRGEERHLSAARLDVVHGRVKKLDRAQCSAVHADQAQPCGAGLGVETGDLVRAGEGVEPHPEHPLRGAELCRPRTQRLVTLASRAVEIPPAAPI